MYDDMKRHEVHTLKKAGFSLRRTADVTGVSQSTVKRVLKEPSVQEIIEITTSRGVGRPSTVEPFRDAVSKLLAQDSKLRSREVLHRLRAQGYKGGKSALYALVAQLRPPDSLPMVRFEGVSGEFSQHDFGQVNVRYLGGGKDRIHFFASKLKYSRWVHVELVPDEKVESLVRGLLAAFEGFGGVPLVAVFDNPKTVVRERREGVIEWNPTFGQVALDYRFAPELCAPRRANQKGAVENLVGWVKGSFFKDRDFHDRQDLDRQLKDWHHEVNEVRPSRATGLVPLQRMEEERKRLRPLAIPASDYALRFPVVVGPTGVVEHGGLRYSMPPESIGFPATLYLYRQRVRIVARRHEANHPRCPEVGQTSLLAEHRSALLAAVSGKRGRLYFMRQQILDLGPEAEAFLTEVVHHHPHSWAGGVELLFNLLQRFGAPRFERALRQAVSKRLFNASALSALLGASA
jgi:transposase